MPSSVMWKTRPRTPVSPARVTMNGGSRSQAMISALDQTDQRRAGDRRTRMAATEPYCDDIGAAG